MVDTMENIKKIVGDIPYLNGEHEAEETFTFDKEKINEQVDERLKKEFDKLMAENAENPIRKTAGNGSEAGGDIVRSH